VCQAVLNTFACYHVDDGNGLYADNQLVRHTLKAHLVAREQHTRTRNFATQLKGQCCSCKQ
jgi:hypothetical protein